MTRGIPRLIAACVALLLQLLAAGAAVAADASLNVFWSVAMPRRAPPVSEFAIWNASADRQGFVSALVWNGSRYLLLIDPSEEQPKPVELPLTGDPIIVEIAHGPDNSVWLAGRARRRSFGPGRDAANPFLVKIDRTGRIVLEYTFSSRTFQQIRGLRPLASGNVIVVRQDESEAWVGSTSPNGRYLWQSRVPVQTSRDIALAVLDTRVLVAGIEEVKVDGKFVREDIVLWTFDSAGVPVARTVVKQGHDGRDLREVKMQRAGDAAYVIMKQGLAGLRSAVDVVKVSADGKVSWRAEIPETMVERPGRDPVVCAPGVTVTRNDDLLVACTIQNRILFVRLAADSGKATRAYAPLPECHGGHDATLFPFQRANGSIWLLGSRPHSLPAPGCAWLASVSLSW